LIFATTFEKMGKWSQIGHKISSFQPIFKDNQPLLNLKKQAQIKRYSASISVCTYNYLQEEKQAKSNRELSSIHEVRTK